MLQKRKKQKALEEATKVKKEQKVKKAMELKIKELGTNLDLEKQKNTMEIIALKK